MEEKSDEHLRANRQWIVLRYPDRKRTEGIKPSGATRNTEPGYLRVSVATNHSHSLQRSIKIPSTQLKCTFRWIKLLYNPVSLVKFYNSRKWLTYMKCSFESTWETIIAIPEQRINAFQQLPRGLRRKSFSDIVAQLIWGFRPLQRSCIFSYSLVLNSALEI